MRIEAVEVSRLEMSLAHPLATSAGTHDRRPVLIVAVTLDGVRGIGECSALAEPTYTEEYADGAEAVLGAHLVPRLIAGGTTFDTLEQGLSRLDAVRGHAMAKAALEMALLDATCTASGCSLAEYLGAVTDRVDAGANVSLGEVPDVLAAVEKVVSAGYRRVKCKIAPGCDVAVVAAVREHFGELSVSVDANGAYRLADPGHVAALRALDGLGLVAIEQPLDPGDLVGHARLAAWADTPVLLDESITSLATLEQAIALKACDGVSVKPARLGGMLVARALAGRCRAEGLHLAIGGMLETGVGRAGALAVGALAGFDLPGDLGGSERYFVPDLTVAHQVHDGALSVPDGPGLGVALDEVVFSTACVRTRRFTA